MIPGHEHGKTVARAGGILFRRVDFGAHRERASRRARGKVCLGTIEARLSELLPFLIGPIRQTGLHPRAAPGVVGGLVAGFLKVVLALCPAQASCKPSSGLSFGSPAGQLAGTHGPFFAGTRRASRSLRARLHLHTVSRSSVGVLLPARRLSAALFHFCIRHVARSPPRKWCGPLWLDPAPFRSSRRRFA